MQRSRGPLACARARASATLAASTTSPASIAAGTAFAMPATSVAGGAQVRAVVTLHGSSAVSAPGVHVVTVFPHIGSEVVTGSAAAVHGLLRDPRVAGVAPDDRVSFAGHDNDGDGHNQFAWQGLDAPAGTANAGPGVTVAILHTAGGGSPRLNRGS